MRRYFLPYYSCFFAPDGGDGGNGGAEPQNPAQNAPQGGSDNNGGQSTEQIVAAVLAAVEARQQRAGDSVIKSMAEQYGMTTDEVKALLKAEQDKKKQQLPPEALAQINAANDKLKNYQLKAEVATIGTAMGLVDAEVALTLLDKTKIVHKDDGSIEGVQAAMDALKTAKPYLFQDKQKPAGWAQNRQGGAPDNKPGTLRDALNEYYKVK